MQERYVSLHFTYNIMRLSILFVLISKNVWKAIPHYLIAQSFCILLQFNKTIWDSYPDKVSGI